MRNTMQYQCVHVVLATKKKLTSLNHDNDNDEIIVYMKQKKKSAYVRENVLKCVYLRFKRRLST